MLLVKMSDIYEIQTPIKPGPGDFYHDYTICTYSLIPRERNHQFSYIFGVLFDFEESKTIKGACDDCMEFEHHDTKAGKRVKSIQCGQKVDDRLNKGGGLVSNIEITFKSDPLTPGADHRGAIFFIADNAVNVSLYMYVATVTKHKCDQSFDSVTKVSKFTFHHEWIPTPIHCTTHLHHSHATDLLWQLFISEFLEMCASHWEHSGTLKCNWPPTTPPPPPMVTCLCYRYCHEKGAKIMVTDLSITVTRLLCIKVSWLHSW